MIGTRLSALLSITTTMHSLLNRPLRARLDQTYAHREVIVVDDGSTDNSRELIATFGGQLRPFSNTTRGRLPRSTPVLSVVGARSLFIWMPMTY